MLTFPIAFLTQGQVATWDYIYEVLGMCFTGGVNLTTLNGTAKTRADPIVAEDLIVTSDGEFVVSASVAEWIGRVPESHYLITA